MWKFVQVLLSTQLSNDAEPVALPLLNNSNLAPTWWEQNKSRACFCFCSAAQTNPVTQMTQKYAKKRKEAIFSWSKTAASCCCNTFCKLVLLVSSVSKLNDNNVLLCRWQMYFMMRINTSLLWKCYHWMNGTLVCSDIFKYMSLFRDISEKI